jgi:4-amino-4-deoxy-L-arabinose transferase-like glycosyltransferase
MKETFFSSRVIRTTALILLLALGFAIRLYDLTDLPLDFHPTRQLFSALKARGMYYQTLTDVPAEQREFAIQQWKFRVSVEPEFFERLVAWSYRFTGEQVWVARIYSSLFWVIGGIFLYLLARELVSAAGALASLAFYLFLPYAVIASRSFQPDPLMIMLLLIFWWAVYKWAVLAIGGRVGGGDLQHSTNSPNAAAVSRPQTWLFAILAGLAGGFAIFIKFVAAFFVIGGGLGAVLGRESLRETVRRPQVYVMSVLGVLPGAAYPIYGLWIAGFLSQQFGGRFIPSLFLSPSYYLGWIGMLNLVTGPVALTLGLLGLFFFEKEKLRFLLGLWAGYALFGMYFNYHISTHDYYSLPLIPIVALCLAPLADSLFVQLAERTSSLWTRAPAFRLPFFRFLLSCLLLFGLLASLWNIRTDLKSTDYRPEGKMWAEIGEKVRPHSVAGLTQDYGARLVFWG